MYSAILLAGGKSERMGQDKRQLRLLSTRLIDLATNRLKAVCEEVLVVMKQVENLGLKEVKIVADVERRRGPMVGLFTGLSEMRNPYGLVIPVDVPFLPLDFLLYLKASAIGYDITIPRWGKRGRAPSWGLLKGYYLSYRGLVGRGRAFSPCVYWRV